MKETAWLFLLPVSNKGQNPENRHVMDLAFGVYKLESAGISRDNIFIAIDGADYEKISEVIEQFTGSKHRIYSTDEIETLRSDATFCSNLVLFVFGHGHELGLSSYKIITPHVLLSEIQKSANIEKAVIYLGPCFSGIFNYLEISGQQKIIFVGSTKFYSSIASRATEQVAGGKKPSWIANFFLLGVFKWFSSPVDIDGDGRYTIMDSYKFVSIYSNSVYANIKKSDFPYLIQRIPMLHKKLVKLGKQYKRYRDGFEGCKALGWNRCVKFYEKLLNDTDLQIRTIKRSINENLEIDLFNIQESWVSDSTGALSTMYVTGSIQ